MFLSYTVWWGPWGGHETSPAAPLGRHGGPAAATCAATATSPRTASASRSSRSPSATGSDGPRRQAAARVVALRPRYHPGWSWWILRVPVLRELVTWNLALVLRQR